MPSAKIKESLANLKKYEKKKDYEKQVVELNHLGNLFIKDENIDEGRSYYQRAIALSSKLKKGHADITRAFRALAETSAEHDESRDTILRAMKEYQTAAKWSNHSQVQLSLHVSAWIYEKICTRGYTSDVNADLEKAALFCKDSIDYLRKYRQEIDGDKDEVREGGMFETRLAKIKRLYSSICVISNKMDLALKLWKDAELMASKINDKDILYELWLTKLDFATNQSDYLRTAQQLLNKAPLKNKGDAMMELSMAKFYNNDLYGSFNELFKLFTDNRLMNGLKSVSEQDTVKDRIVRLYNIKELIAEADSSKCSTGRLRKIYEAVADATQHFGSDWKMLSVGMLYYSYMLKYSVSKSEKMLAMESLAVTSLDIAKDRETKDAWQTTYDYHKRLYSIKESLLTKCEMFEISCKGRLKPAEELKSDFDELVGEVPDAAEFLRSKGSIYGAYGTFLSGINSEEADIYLEKEKEIRSMIPVDNVHEISDDAEEEIDPATRAAVLSKLKAMSNRKQLMDKWKKQLNKRINKDGETNLHGAAQNNDQDHLKILLDMGYDPNMKCYSGFTALSEAVIHGVVQNARMLLVKKAKVDVRSKEGLYDDESESGWVTPLMEACHTGNVDMIKLLLHFDASVVLANDDKWTAVDFLRDYRNSRAGEEELLGVDHLIAKMEELQRENGYPVRKGPPPAWQKRVRETFAKANKRKPRSFANQHLKNLDDYNRTIDGLGSRVSRADSRQDERDDSLDIGHQDELMSDGETCHSRPSSRLMDEITSRRGSSEHRISDQLPEMIVDSIFSRDDSDDDIIMCESINSTPAPRRSSGDGFIVDDVRPSKKRKIVSQRDDNKRRKNDTPHISDVVVSPLAEVPFNVVKSDRYSLRRSRVVISDDEDDIVSTSAPATPSNSVFNSTSISPSVSSKINVIVHCLDDNNKEFKGPKMDSLHSDSTIEAMRKLYEARLEVHQRKFDLFQDGIELDDTIVVSSLLNTNGRYVIQLILRPVTALSIYQANTASSSNAEVVELLDNLKITKNMDLSSVECDSDLSIVLKAVVESNTEVCEIRLDKCHIKEEAYKYICNIMPNASKISLKSTGINHNFITSASMNQSSLFSVTSLDLSHTDLKCGMSVASFLKKTPLLKELILRGVDISQGEQDLVSAICSLPKLQKLDLCCCDWLGTESVQSILSGCSKVTSLTLTGVDLSNVEFLPLVLPECRRLSLSSTGFTNWTSLCSWLADVNTNVEWINLSCCDSLTHKEVESIVNARSEFDKLLNVRIVRCESLLRDFRPVFKRLEDVVSYRKLKRSSIISPVILEVSCDVYAKAKGQEPNSLIYIKLV